jgi:hypothetical protein
MSTQLHADRPAAPELTWVGHGAWVARDPSLPANEARSVIAFIEHRDHHVSVLWVRDRRDASTYDSLREACDAVAAGCESGLTEVRAR